MTTLVPKKLVVNNREYQMPQQPMVVICLDGCEPEYLEVAIAAGKMPALSRIQKSGTSLLAHSVIPSFTNPNNMSIATGQPPAVHGICGNYLYDTENDEEVMMNDPRFLRAPTVFSAYYDAGARVALVTAKDKLRTLLGHGLSYTDERAICFSSERSDTTTKSEHGIDNAAAWLGREVPEVYSAELSEFVFAAGVKLLQEFKPDVMYLSTTDYVQHKYAPNDADAIAFYTMFDKYLDQLDLMGAVVVLTADHGMKPKHLADGSPDVLYVQDVLDEWLGDEAARVILPITDPYVVHHGALGSFATAYLPDNCDQQDIIKRLAMLDGMDVVLDRAAACERFELPADRIGDVVMVSTSNKVLGTSASRHDLASLKEPLRSHGGLSEQTVPFIINRVVKDIEAGPPTLRNFDALYYAACAAVNAAS
ncbi:MAG: phosphonoacetate hydrolase [Granulosicoccus sp.]